MNAVNNDRTWIYVVRLQFWYLNSFTNFQYDILACNVNRLSRLGLRKSGRFWIIQRIHIHCTWNIVVCLKFQNLRSMIWHHIIALWGSLKWIRSIFDNTRFDQTKLLSQIYWFVSILQIINLVLLWNIYVCILSRSCMCVATHRPNAVTFYLNKMFVSHNTLYCNPACYSWVLFCQDIVIFHNLHYIILKLLKLQFSFQL